MRPVIAESLAGTRIAITGSTGFVGTALVERLLRSVPGCELVLLVRDGKRSPAARRVERELLRNDAFDRLRARARHRRASTRWPRRRDHDDRRRRRHRRPRPVGRRPRRPGQLRRRHPLGGRRLVRLAARLRPSRSTCSDRCAIAAAAAGARRATAPRVRVDVLRRRQPARHGAGGAGQRRPVRPRPRLADRGRRGPPAARRRRGGQPPARPAGRAAQGGPHRARRCGRAGAGGEDRAAARALGARPARRGRPGPGRQHRLARRLRLHEGARRAGADRHARATCR